MALRTACGALEEDSIIDSVKTHGRIFRTVNAYSGKFVDHTVSAAEDFLFGEASSVVKMRIESGFNKVRMSVARGSGAMAGTLTAKFIKTYSGTVGDWTSLGAAVTITAENTPATCTWQDIAASAVGENVFVCVTEEGGDGSTKGNIGNVMISFRGTQTWTEE